MGRKTSRTVSLLLKITGGLLLLCLVAVLALFLYFRHLKNSLTAEKPMTIRKAEVTQTDRRQLGTAYQKLRNGVTKGTSVEIELLSEQLDKMIAVADELKPLRDSISLALEDDCIRATVSIPVDRMPMLQGRYLNGAFKIRASVEDGVLKANVLEGKTENGEPYPDWIIANVNSMLASPEKLSALGRQDWIRHLKLMQISQGKLKLRTK